MTDLGPHTQDALHAARASMTYATIEEALAGHEAAIEEVKSETGTQ
jgi:hypothetical protein